MLGGNGAIESFSILPRLLRDMIVCENWEGTHNTLTAQVHRDMMRLGVHEGFFAFVRARLDACAPSGATRSLHAATGRATDALHAAVTQALALAPDLATLRLCPLVEELAWLGWAVALVEQATWEHERHGDAALARLAEYWWNLRLARRGGELEVDELARIRELAQPSAG